MRSVMFVVVFVLAFASGKASVLAANDDGGGMTPPPPPATDGSGGVMHLPDHFMGDLLAMFAFGMVAIVIICLGYKAFDRVTKNHADPMASAILDGSMILGLCYVVAKIIAAVIS